jgi:tetratricopeptide (TPR) repeat protein
MERTTLTLEAIGRLLPDIDELEELRLCLAGASEPDPGKRWDRSRAYATLDKRILTLARVERAAEEAEAALHLHISELFSALRPVLRAYWAGEEAEAARLLIELGERLEERGRYRKALHSYEAALRLALPLLAKAPQILALRRIARVEAAVGDLHEALLYYRRSAELARHAEDVQGEVIGITGCGNVLAFQGRWSEAEGRYRTALARLPAGPHAETLSLERAQLYNNLALIATRQGHFREADGWLAEARELWERFEAPADLAVFHHVMGTLRGKQGRREEARACFARALDLPISAAARAVILIDLAESFLDDGVIGEASAHGRAAEQLALLAHSPYSLGETYRGLGNIARARGDDEGITFFEKALEIARAKRYPLLEGETLLEYARLRSQMSGEEEALAYLQRAREIFAELGAVHEQERAERLIGELSYRARPGAAD